MKKNLLSLCMLALSSVVSAQNKIVYTYDASGNVISRLLTFGAEQTRAVASPDSLFMQNMGNSNIRIYPNPTASIVTIEGMNKECMIGYQKKVCGELLGFIIILKNIK